MRRAVEHLLSLETVVLCGACGTELSRRGVATPLPLWSAAALIEAPDVVREIHRDHVLAGADLVTANTFRADRRTLGRAGVTLGSRDLVKTAVRLAREGVALAAVERSIAVAGSVAPLEDCYRPDLVPPDPTLRAEHGARVGDLIAAGADLVLVETMNTIREAVAAMGACRAGNIPGAVSFVCGPGARLLSGEAVADAVAAVLPLRPIAVLVNCCALPAAGEALRALLAAAGSVPTGIYANGLGRPDDAAGWVFDDVGADAAAYAGEAVRWRAMGARWIGGCCGTTPEHVRAVAGTLGRQYGVG